VTLTPQFAQLLATRDVVPYTADVSEVAGLYRKAIRAMADSQLSGLSAEGAVERAYDAARLAATAVLHCAGYRVKNVTGHHHHSENASRRRGTHAVRPLTMRASTMTSFGSSFQHCAAPSASSFRLRARG
jgi:hypothetical protein